MVRAVLKGWARCCCHPARKPANGWQEIGQYILPNMTTYRVQHMSDLGGQRCTRARVVSAGCARWPPQLVLHAATGGVLCARVSPAAAGLRSQEAPECIWRSAGTVRSFACNSGSAGIQPVAPVPDHRAYTVACKNSSVLPLPPCFTHAGACTLSEHFGTLLHVHFLELIRSAQ
jgi:hypothetical protein